MATNILRRCNNHSLARFGKLLHAQKYDVQKVQKTYLSECDGPPVIIDEDENITLIGLNRHTTRNALNNEAAKYLSDAIHSFEQDTRSLVAVIYGIGGSLCAGQDLTELENTFENKDLNENHNALRSNGLIRRHTRKPIVCGINGYCVADGLELALFCDLRVMEDTAVLGFFGRAAGLHLKCGGAARLPAMIGYSRSLDLLLTGRRVCAKEALQIGLVNRVVATGTALGQAVHLAFSIAKFPFEALQRDRANLYLNNYERRKGLSVAIQNEKAPINAAVKNEIQENIIRFKNGKNKGQTMTLSQAKPKTVPKWEHEEMLHEQGYKNKLSQ